MSSPPAKSYTREEVASHASDGDMWMVVHGRVYDVSKFARMHPGGEHFIHKYAGKDGTKAFDAFHRQDVLTGMAARFCIGTVAEEPPFPLAAPGDISAVPYAETSYWHSWKSPYYTESHVKFRAAIRDFFDREVMPDAAKLDDMGKEPSEELYRKMGQFGILAARIGRGPWLEGLQLPGGLPASEFEYFHEQIAHEEVARLGVPGFCDGLGAGLIIGLPPVLHYGRPELAKRVGRECLLGEKRICLAISEPHAGSDVAGMATTATKSECGRFWVVRGAKKWITNGSFCDYFVTACRTGKGITLLLVERSEGLSTKKIKTSYSPSAGTAYVLYEDVRVPVENTLGEENKGFQCIMHNFNHERWFIVAGVNRASRLIVEECFKWAHQRVVFGKPLISQPVIRNKLAHMVAQVEGVQSWLELVTYQMNKMDYKEQNKHLGGPIALLKLAATRAANHVNDEACQIFGGRAITRTGMGRVIEGFQRSIKYGAILGGSEEIMADLGIRQAMKQYPPTARL
eukprot:CAMPEP_0183812874 /NCGR_PEP_ID=MMETSP0803_2-20130417/51982_1 /TAXON_ID=195967 /ORGANISM="Crustomastix stigmata, Strain CCMP3273" /LENGTH=513 /DNA_ID=CAMNT_0026057717 /DNA_START=17 /DNA_END=1558 /DNA_ORIENTATION=-